MLKHASLFSGIGGFDLAAESMGWENVFNCEIDNFCQTVLKYHFPNATQYGDIRKIKGEEYEGRVDVLTGGFPCQPFSAAGKRRGTEDNRFLWGEMFRVIQTVKPSWVIAENVRGILSIEDGMVFERVCTDMENNGFEVQPLCIPACAVGAPHRRDRIWFIAYSECNERRRQERRGNEEENGVQEEHRKKYSATRRIGGADRITTDCKNEQCKRRECSGSTGGKPKKKTRNGNSNATYTRCEHGKQRGAEGYDRQESKWSAQAKEFKRHGEAWDKQTWLEAATRLCGLHDGLPRKLDGITVPKWRRESLRAYGNAIVPQVAYKIFEAIQSSEKT